MEIKVLGSGCKTCTAMYDAFVRIASENEFSDAHIQKITDMQVILDYGVMMTPAIVVDETLLAPGTVKTEDDILRVLRTGA